jgi:hypothetical protein
MLTRLYSPPWYILALVSFETNLPRRHRYTRSPVLFSPKAPAARVGLTPHTGLASGILRPL